MSSKKKYIKLRKPVTLPSLGYKSCCHCQNSCLAPPPCEEADLKLTNLHIYILKSLAAAPCTRCLSYTGLGGTVVPGTCRPYLEYLHFSGNFTQ